MSWKSPRCGQACWDEIKRHDDEREKIVVALVNMTRDRDEWREQHENLLAMYRTAALARPSETVPANEDEAGRGLNDTFPGDPYPVAGVLQGIRQRSVQAMHAGISRRDWWATEVAANELRDRIDDLIRRLGTYSVTSSREL